MARRGVPLTLDRLEATGSPCARCLFWELDPVRRDRVAEDERAEEKQALVSERLREWGSCGRVLLVDGVEVAHVLYAPAGHLPGAGAFPTAPAGEDAVLLAGLWVHPDHRGGGLGRMLVQQAARDLVGRGVRALEAFGSHGSAPGCAAPAEFLARVGFRTVRPHPVAPRMRMDLRTALTWREEVEAALGRLAGVVRPAPAPAPERRVPAVRRDDGDAD
ncbi:GNAT family N-acetyltransferase [Nocardioides bruguierae]|uniref:GNAT family N-acetyltransferase n=1 Tax=Nocardioides bruguierae TaxID=2945102 RepID=A0A9X2D8W6_9ACTN|nr:GNAT family N-acetyltransferase [Nocardioides bruguierae]MCM0620972.1 GNAT family N-acetyltransferase [Nocardioides bruguierae]